MAALISEIVGSNAESELEKLLKQLTSVEKELDVINGKAISLKIDFQGVGTLSELTAMYKRQDEVLGSLRTSADGYKRILGEAAEMIKNHNGHSKEFVQVSQGVAKTLTEEARARKENAKAMLDEQKYVAALNKEKENQEAKAEKARIAAEKESNAYLQLRKAYNEQSTALKGMIVQYGLADEKVKLLKADTDKMYQSLLKAEEAVGQHQRKVGQYQNATMALSQLIREAPAFANSVNTGLMGISNNIPILIDQFKILRAEVGSTGKALKIMGASFFGFTNLLSIGMTAFMMYSMGVFDFGQKADKASEQGKKLQSTLQGINEEARNSALAEMESTDKLFSTAENLNSAYGDRISAIEKLISLYPELLGHIEREAFLTGNVAEKQKIQEIISYKSAIEARKKGIEEFKKQITDLKTNANLDEDGLNVFGETYDPTDYSASKYTTQSPKTQKEIDRLTSLMTAYTVAKNSFEQSLAQLTSTKHEGRIYEDIQNDIEEQTRLVKTTVEGTKAHTQALADLKKFQEEMDRYMGKEKKDKKDKGLSEAIEDEKARHKLQLELNEQAFLNSRQTFYEQQQLNEGNANEARTHAENMTLITTDWHKKSGESEEKYQARLKEINAELIKELNEAKKAGDKIREAIIQGHIKANEESQKYIESLQKQRAELQKINDEIDALQAKAASRKEYAESINPLLEGFGFNTSFKQAVRQKNLDIAAQQNKVNKANSAIVSLKESDDPKNYGIKLGELKVKAANEQKTLSQLELEREDMYNQKIIEGKKKLAQESVKAATDAINEISAKQDDEYKRQLARIDELQRKALINSQLEIMAIQGRAGYQIEKENEIAKVTAQARSQEAAFEAERRSINIAQAKFTRENAIATAILNGAVGVTKIWAEYGAQPLIAAALTALQAGIVASQISRAQSAPVPQYAEGTEDHKGGLAIIGDGGEPEYVSTPTGEAFWSKPTSTLIDLPKHSTVTPLSQIAKFILTGNLLPTPNIEALKSAQINQTTDQRIIERLDDIHDTFIQSAVRSGTNVNVNIKSDTNRRIYNRS
ncbi:MAG: hypothetical protein K0Q79_2741 [Flavipsychrobacter sp.]|jgi:hypothetical protein|nr:hypothetical protein [Flavipsychrobacter sp.]